MQGRGPISLLTRPFRGFEHPKRVWAWSMYDLANQSFTLIINTLLFSQFFKFVVVGDPASPAPGSQSKGDFLWSITVSMSLAIVVLLSPITGAMADCRGTKRRWLIGTGVTCGVLTCALALLPASPPGDLSMWVLIAAMAVYIPANVAFNLGENFLGSFLPEIASRERMGRASAIGFTMGYIGALTLLIIVAVSASIFHLAGPDQHRPLFLVAGLWFLIMMIPTVLYLPETSPAVMPGWRSAAGVAFQRLRTTVRHASQFRDLMALLGAFLVYGCGVQVIVFFAGLIAKDDFGFGVKSLMIFALQLAVTSGVAAVLVGMLQDRIGHRRTILLSLGVWFATALGLAFIAHQRNVVVSAGGAYPSWPIWVVGNGIGFGIGAIGSSTRAAVGAFTPKLRTAEFFSLWGLTYKLAGAVGLPIFGAVRSWIGSTASLVTLSVFFVMGALILMLVNEKRGMAAAHHSERGMDVPTPHTTL